MLRALLGFALSWAALKLAGLAGRLLPPRPFVPVEVRVHPELRREPDRYARELVRLDLVRADGAFCLALGNSPLYYDGRTFSKVADPRWRQ